MANKSAADVTVRKKPLMTQIKKYIYKGFYLMFLPVVANFCVGVPYLPMLTLGIRYAFFSYKGIKNPYLSGWSISRKW